MKSAGKRTKLTISSKIAFTYMIVSAVWLFTDQVLDDLKLATSLTVHSLTGLSYVFVTAWLLHVCVQLYEKKLRETEERYRHLVEFSPDPIIVYSEGKVEYVNPAGARVIGASNLDELLGKSILEFVQPDFMERMQHTFRESRENGEPSSLFETKLFRLDGEIIDVEVRAVSTHYLGKSATEILCRDITERKRTEAALLEAENKYRSLVEEALVGVYMCQDGRYLYVNPRCAQIYGYTQEELCNMNLTDLVFPEDKPMFVEHIRKRLEGEVRTSHFQIRALKKDHSIIELEVIGTITSYNRKPAIIGTLMDITERTRTEELLRKSDKLAVIGQLAAGVAHEIRNPLTALRGFVQLLMTKVQEHDEYFKIMLSELDRINFIVSEFMAIAKPQAVHFQKKQLEPILQDVISLLDTQAIINNIQIYTEFRGELPPVNCDENQLKQLFINILKNAIEAMPGGGQITVQAIKDERGRIRIRCIDCGGGIPAERIQKLGEPFYTTKEKGTGLGLMISYKIVESHKGTLDIQSEIGQGTTVDVILPVEEADLRV